MKFLNKFSLVIGIFLFFLGLTFASEARASESAPGQFCDSPGSYPYSCGENRWLTDYPDEYYSQTTLTISIQQRSGEPWSVGGWFCLRRDSGGDRCIEMPNVAGGPFTYNIPGGPEFNRVSFVFTGLNILYANFSISTSISTQPPPTPTPTPSPPTPPPTGTVECYPDQQVVLPENQPVSINAIGGSSYIWASDGDPWADNDANYNTTFGTEGWHTATVTAPEGEASCQIYVGEFNSPGNTDVFFKGYAFEDYDKDGFMETGEPAMPGVTIELNGWASPNTNSSGDACGNKITRNNVINGLTNASGYYEFGHPDPNEIPPLNEDFSGNPYPGYDPGDQCTIEDNWNITAYIPTGYTSTGLSDENPEPNITGLAYYPNLVHNFGFFTPRPPIVTTDPPSSITSTSVTLNGRANPRGSSSTGWFRYSTTDPSGNCNNLSSISGSTPLVDVVYDVPYSNNLSGLSSNTTYYYCAIASNVAGTGYGSVVSFTTPPANFTLTVIVTGNGTVTEGSNINCPGDCSEPYLQGTSVTLTATPDASSAFGGWTGDCNGSGQVTMTANRTCTATFGPQRTLTVTKSGAGSGTVTSLPVGINCGATCLALFAQGSVVTLAATPTAGSVFDGWGGNCNSSGQVTMSSNRSCSASFDLVPSAPSGLTLDNSGNCGEIELNWNDNSNNEDGFRIYRGTSAGSLALVYTINNNNEESYTDTPPTSGVVYYYQVTAFSSSPFAESSPTNTASAMNITCSANLVSSNKTLYEVNGVAYNSSTKIKTGDTVKFRIILSNAGTADADVNYICDTPSSNFTGLTNLRLGNGSRTFTAGAPECNGGYRFNISGSKSPGGSNWDITFDMTFQSSGAGTVELCSNSATINYDDEEAPNRTHTEKFGPTFCNKGVTIPPNFEEIAP